MTIGFFLLCIIVALFDDDDEKKDDDANATAKTEQVEKKDSVIVNEPLEGDPYQELDDLIGLGSVKTEVRSPFPDGLFGMDSQRTNKALRRLLRAGLVNSRIDGPDHVYYIHVERFKVLEEFVDGCVNNHAEKA